MRNNLERPSAARLATAVAAIIVASALVLLALLFILGYQLAEEDDLALLLAELAVMGVIAIGLFWLGLRLLRVKDRPRG